MLFCNLAFVETRIARRRSAVIICTNCRRLAMRSAKASVSSLGERPDLGFGRFGKARDDSCIDRVGLGAFGKGIGEGTQVS